MPPTTKADCLVSVVVPWRSGCPHREAVWSFVRGRYAEHFPTWQVIEGRHEVDDWCKAEAVRDGLASATGEVLIVADADIWTEGLERAVDEVVSGRAPWAIPHLMVCRLDEGSTAAWIAGNDGPFTYTQQPYKGYAGGGAMVLRRKTYEASPLDRRFRGWGQEDSAWHLALCRTHGRGWRGRADLLHGWHPPQDRMCRQIGSEASSELLSRYQRARTPEQMAALIAEVTDGREDRSEPQRDPRPAPV